MKYIFSILLIFSFNLSFGQTTVSEMMRVYKMDMDQFETYALNNGYKFNNLVDEENVYGTTYVKGVGKNTKFLTLNTTFYHDGKRVKFQTYKSSEFLKFKKELISKGFVLINTESFEGSIKKIYTFQDWVFRIYSGVDADNDEL